MYIPAQGQPEAQDWKKYKTVTRSDLATMTVICSDTDQEEERDVERGCVTTWPPCHHETWTILQHYSSTMQLQWGLSSPSTLPTFLPAGKCSPCTGQYQ